MRHPAPSWILHFSESPENKTIDRIFNNPGFATDFFLKQPAPLSIPAAIQYNWNMVLDTVGELRSWGVEGVECIASRYEM